MKNKSVALFLALFTTLLGLTAKNAILIVEFAMEATDPIEVVCALHRITAGLLALPDLPATSRERMTWIDGHYAHLRAIFSGDPAFLEYDPADPSAPSRISAHIGRDLPWWGKANANPTHAHTDDDTQEDAA